MLKVEKLWTKNFVGKDEMESEKHRNKGNDYLKIDQLETALDMYNEAVLLAEPEGVNLSLALANRSVVLAKIKAHRQNIEGNIIRIFYVTH